MQFLSFPFNYFERYLSIQTVYCTMSNFYKLLLIWLEQRFYSINNDANRLVNAPADKMQSYAFNSSCALLSGAALTYS